MVIDASALLEFILQTPLGARVEARVLRAGDELHTPHLADVDVVQALRRLVRMGEVSAARASEANPVCSGSTGSPIVVAAWK